MKIKMYIPDAEAKTWKDMYVRSQIVKNDSKFKVQQLYYLDYSFLQCKLNTYKTKPLSHCCRTFFQLFLETAIIKIV